MRIFNRFIMKKPPIIKTYYRSREKQAEKILKILEDYLKSDLQNFTCLDIGCSTGMMSNIFRTHFRQVVGFDIDKKLIREAKQSGQLDDVSLLVADGGHAPFIDESFAIIICAQIYEHTKNQNSLVSEIWRMLDKNGICFFSGPNRIYINEEHYRLPFLSWLPKSLANLYIRLFRKGTEYDIYPLNYWQLKKLLRSFVIHDYTLKIIMHPEQFGFNIKNWTFSIFKKLPGWIQDYLPMVTPNFNWVLVKKENNTENITTDD